MIWLQVIGWGSTAIVIWSMMQTRIMRLRVWNMIGCFGQIVYNSVIHAWPVVALNAILAIIQIINIWKLTRSKADSASYEVIVTDPQDQLVSHIFAINHSDIWKFNSRKDARESAAQAFVIMLNNELIGLVLSHDTRPGEAFLDLDYVTEKYRDFTPGRFLFGEQGWFAQHGYSSVVAPADGPDYYLKVGFSAAGDNYRKELHTLV